MSGVAKGFSAELLIALGNPEQLTDEQITELLEQEKDIIELGYRINRLPSFVKRIQNYRQRKKELNTLPTEELQRMRREITESRVAAVDADEHDELPDSFFESPPFDSAECILSAILKERAKKK